MKIEIEENEIKEAILDYVAKQGFSVDPTVAEVDIKNSRGDFGVTATISVTKVEPATVTAIKTEPKKKKEAAKEVSKSEEEDGNKEPAPGKPLFS